MEKGKKKKRGDRTDGYLVRDLDPLHMFMPYLMGSRTENEAVMNEEFDLQHPFPQQLFQKQHNFHLDINYLCEQ